MLAEGDTRKEAAVLIKDTDAMININRVRGPAFRRVPIPWSP